MSYRLSLWTRGIIDKTKHYMSRGQAYHGARLMAYDRLQAYALLDTKAAHMVMDAIDRREKSSERTKCESVATFDILGTPYSLYIEQR